MENDPARTRRRQWIFVFLLAAVTILVYQAVWQAGFIWDDNLLLVDNPLIRQSDGWWRSWCTKAIDYVPLVSSTWWVEWRLWQNNPPAFHWVNLFWQIGNAILLWRVLGRLQIAGAGLAAFLFALHPVNVETAAWVAEQKNTEAMFFFLTAILCHINFENTPRQRWYWAALGSFLLALACKTAVAPLPLVLLGIVWWRRGKLAIPDFVRSIPFFALAGVAAIIAVWIQRGGTPSMGGGETTFLFRLVRAGQAIWFYLYKDLFPINLVSIHPKWTIHPANPMAWLPGVLFAALLLFLARSKHKWARAGLFGLGYFVLLLLPALGFVDISLMRYTWVADHWQYFAIIGPVTLMAAALAALARWNARAGRALAGLVLASFAVLSWAQAGIYKSGDIFWAEFMRVNRPAIAAYDAGTRLLSNGRTNEALDRFREAVRLQPAFALPYNSIGRIDLEKGNMDEALSLLQEAVELRPDFPEAQENLGDVLLAKSRTAEALEHLQRSADLQPHNALAQFGFGDTLLQMGLASDALAYFKKALALRPDYVEVQSEMGNAFQAMKQIPDAIASYQTALHLRPDFLPALNNLAWLLATTRDSSRRNGSKAVDLAQRAAKLSGGTRPAILGTLAAARAETGDFQQALDLAKQALALAVEQGNSAFADTLRSQIKQYEARQPWRE